MQFKVLNWNIGGAKVLEQKNQKDRKQIRTTINEALIQMLNDRNIGPQPDVVTLQEIVQYKQPSDPEVINVIDKIDGYNYFPFPLIDSSKLSSKAKWNKIKEGSDWHPDTFFSQGNAFLIKNDSPHFPVWDLSVKQTLPISEEQPFMEKVHLDSGLYFGDRNTEPRAAIVAHFIYYPIGETGIKSKKPLDVFVINLHLTTLMMEREGVPEIDMLASNIRKGQLEIIFNGIISRYNSWRQKGYLERGKERETQEHETFDRHSPVWVISGDFNFTEDSAEFEHISRMNFIDTVPNKTTIWGEGTKAKGLGKDPTLTLDYIFAGPKFLSLDPAILPEFQTNKIIHDHKFRASDHYPILSSIKLIHT